MKTMPEKSARFASVVQAAGEPEPVYLWTDPKEDKRLMAAVKQDRVLTVKPASPGTKRDIGVVGFTPEKSASYLVFPKPLSAFKDRRIVGIKYDLVRTPGPVGRVVQPGPESGRTGPIEPPAGAERSRLAPKPPSPLAKRFWVTIRFTATAEVSQEVEADSRQRAREIAERSVLAPDLGRATITRKVVRVAPQQ